MGGDLPPPPHSRLNVGLILATAASFLLMIIFNALAGSGAGVGSVFISTVGNISDKYQLYITPAGFTFTIWSVIFLWLALSEVLLLVSLFRQTEFGRLYLSPEVATPPFSATLTLNFLLNTSWIFIWDRSFNNPDLIAVASLFLFLIVITNILALSLMAWSLAQHAHEFSRGSPLFAWGVLYRLMLNGLGVYTTWCVIASLINLATALVYVGGVDQRAACLVSLSLLVICHTSWFIIENFLVDKYARYLLTPYLVVIWASNGVRAKKSDDPDVPQDVKDFVLAILVIATITFLVRLGLVIYRCVRKPLTKMSTVSEFNTQ